jgi:hypothetical protein
MRPWRASSPLEEPDVRAPSCPEQMTRRFYLILSYPWRVRFVVATALLALIVNSARAENDCRSVDVRFT